jgi:predicted nucleic acid-binding protein
MLSRGWGRSEKTKRRNDQNGIITSMKIYLDTCCLNRPFDDQRQPRIRLEAEAVTLVLEKIRQREWNWVGSEVLMYEIEQTANTERKERLLFLAQEANQTVEISEKIIERAEALSSLGFGEYDALHLASAESAKVDVFLTTDDPLQTIANRNKKRLSSLIVSNPVKWLEEVLKK